MRPVSFYQGSGDVLYFRRSMKQPNCEWCVCTNSELHLPEQKKVKMLCKVLHCAGHISANTRRLISCAGVTGRWGLLSHAQNVVEQLTLSIQLVEVTWTWCLFLQLSFEVVAMMRVIVMYVLLLCIFTILTE